MIGILSGSDAVSLAFSQVMKLTLFYKTSTQTTCIFSLIFFIFVAFSSKRKSVFEIKKKGKPLKTSLS